MSGMSGILSYSSRHVAAWNRNRYLNSVLGKATDVSNFLSLPSWFTLGVV